MAGPYPFAETPADYALDETYRRGIERASSLWSENGYQWKFGAEYEFILFTQKDTRAMLEQMPASERAKAPYRNFADLFDKTERSTERGTEKMLAEVAYLKTRINEGGRALPRHFGMTKAGMMKVVKSIEDGLHSDEMQVQFDALCSLIMASLHLRPLSEGGIFEIASPRFGDDIYGKGWWDNPGVAEVRTEILDSPEALIDQYHTMMRAIAGTTTRFGLVPLMTSYPHVHFSIWDKQSGKNITAMADDESLDLSERALYGICRTMQEAPALIQDIDLADPMNHMHMGSGGSRLHAIRQLADNWEFRNSADHNMPHLARDLMILMGGAAYGAFGTAESDIAQQKERGTFPVMRVTVPTVEHTFGATSALKSTIENSEIGKNGLEPDYSLILHNMRRMKAEIGEHAVNAYQAVKLYPGHPHEQAHNLDYAEAWMQMFYQLRIGDDGQLDLSSLHPELREAFEPLRVTGTRTILRLQNGDVEADILPLIRKTAKLAQSKSLSFLYDAADVQALHSFQNDKFAAIGSALAANMAGRLADTLERLPEDRDSARDAVIRFCYMNIFKLAAHEQGNHWPELEDGEKMPELPSVKADFEGNDTFMKFITPLFNEAVKNEIENARAAQKSNRTIAFLEEARTFVEREFFDYANYQSLLFIGVMREVAANVGTPALSPMNLMMLNVAQSLSQNAFFTNVMSQPDITLDETLDMTRRCRANLHTFAASIDEIAKVPEGASDAQRAEFEHFVKGYVRLLDDGYNSLEKQILTMQENETRQKAGLKTEEVERGLRKAIFNYIDKEP